MTCETYVVCFTSCLPVLPQADVDDDPDDDKGTFRPRKELQREKQAAELQRREEEEDVARQKLLG